MKDRYEIKIKECILGHSEVKKLIRLKPQQRILASSYIIVYLSIRDFYIITSL